MKEREPFYRLSSGYSSSFSSGLLAYLPSTSAKASLVLPTSQLLRLLPSIKSSTISHKVLTATEVRLKAMNGRAVKIKKIEVTITVNL